MTVNDTAQNQPYFAVKDLRVSFRDGKNMLTVVENVNISLNKQEVLGLVGESACGKSMTALSVLRLLPPGGVISGGEVLLEGENLLELSKEKMRRIRGKKIAMIFQDPATALNPVRTIKAQFIETLTAGRSYTREEARDRALEMISLLGLSSPETVMGRYPFQLSGGMRQRVMIALALAPRPDILIADEPTTALDVTVQAQILAEIRRLKDEFKAAVILISHNMGVIAQLSDRVAVMYAGSIVEDGSARAVFNHPAHPYTRALLNSVPDLSRSSNHLCSIQGQPPVPGRMPAGCSFSPRCNRAIEKCHRERPSWVNMEKGHRVSCFRPLTENSCCENH